MDQRYNKFGYPMQLQGVATIREMMRDVAVTPPVIQDVPGASWMGSPMNVLRTEEKEGIVPMVYIRPWAPQPTITMRGYVNTAIVKSFRLANTEPEEDKYVKVYKEPSKEIGLQINKTNFILPRCAALEIKLLWQPEHSGHWEESLLYEDDKARKGGVVIVFHAEEEPSVKPTSALPSKVNTKDACLI